MPVARGCLRSLKVRRFGEFVRLLDSPFNWNGSCTLTVIKATSWNGVLVERRLAIVWYTLSALNAFGCVVRSLWFKDLI